MRHFTKLLIAFCLFGFGIKIHAQNAIPASGGNATGAGGSITYTIGQAIYQTITGTTGTVAQGVQQPYEISVVTAIEEASGIILECTVFPNPTTDVLMLKIKDYDTQNLSYQLINISGNIIENRKVFSDEVHISMGKFPSGTFLLRVTVNNKYLKTFKIIKN